MNKKLISVLLIIVVLGGCTSKSSGPKIATVIDFTTPTCVITSGAANNSSPTNIMIPANGNYVTVSAYFTGSSPNTTVTIGGPNGGTLMSSQSNKWCSFKLASPTTQQNNTIAVSNPVKNYDTVFTFPGQPNVNNFYGVNTSIYSHKTGGDSVIVVVQDSAVVAP